MNPSILQHNSEILRQNDSDLVAMVLDGQNRLTLVESYSGHVFRWIHNLDGSIDQKVRLAVMATYNAMMQAAPLKGQEHELLDLIDRDPLMSHLNNGNYR